MKRLAFVLAAIVMGPLAGSAQRAGDVVAATWPYVINIPPSGRATTLFTVGAGITQVRALQPATANQGLLYSRFRIDGLSQLVHRDGGNVTTLVHLPNTRLFEFTLTAAGRVVFVVPGTSADSLREVPRGGGPARVIATLPRLLSGDVFALTEDIATGDLLLFNRRISHGIMRRVTRGGVVTSFTLPLPLTTATNDGDAHFDVASGQYLVGSVGAMIRVDPRTGAATSLWVPALSVFGRGPLDYDPFRQDFLLATQATVYRYAPRLATAATLFTGNAAQPVQDLTVFGTRMLSGLDAPRAGSRFRIALSMPGEAGRRYVVTASTGFRPGIALGNGLVSPQRLDALFYLSLAPSPFFVNFTGVLSPTGRAALAVNSPPGIAGFRVYFAAASFGAAGFRVVSEPFGVTVE